MNEAIVESLFGGEGVESNPVPGTAWRFCDEDAAATRIPLFLTARMNLNASGKAPNRPCSMSWTTRFCLTAAYMFASPVHIGHAEVLKRSPGACQPWLGGHYLLVHLGRKPLGRPAGLVPDIAPVAIQ